MIYMYFQCSVRKALQKTGEITFVDFINNYSSYDMYDSSFIKKNQLENKEISVEPNSERNEFYFKVDVATDIVIDKLVKNINNVNYWNCDYDYHIFDVLYKDQPIKLSKVNPKVKYFNNLFNLKKPHTLKFSNDTFVVNSNEKYNIKFKINEKEKAGLLKILKIKRSLSILYSMYLIEICAKNPSSTINFFMPDGSSIDINALIYILKLKLLQEIYNTLY